MARIDAGRGREVLANTPGLTPSTQTRISDLGVSAIGAAVQNHDARRQQREGERRVREDRLRTAQVVGETERSLSAYLNESGDAYDGSEPGFAEAAGEQVSQIISQTLEGLDPQFADQIAPRLESARQSALLSAQELEDTRRESYVLRSIGDTAQATANAIRSDPSLFYAQIDTLPDLAGGAPANLSSRVEAETGAMWARAYAEGRIAEDPEAALSELNAGELDGYLAGQAKDVLIGQAETAIRQAEREAERQAREARLYGLITMGPMAEDHLASVAATGQGVEGFDANRYAALLDPRDAQRFRQRLDRAGAVYEALGDLPDLPASELNTRLAALRPTPGQPGFAQASEIYDAAVNAVAREQRLRSEDPARAAQRSGAVSQAREIALAVEDEADLSVGGNGAAAARREQYARSVLAEQERLGVPAGARRVLTEAEASAYVAQYEQSDDRGRALRDILLGVQEYGELAPQVISELAEAGLPEGVRFAAALPGDPAVLTRYARALTNRATHEDRMKPSDIRSLEDAAWGQIETLAETFGHSPNGAETAAALSDGVYALALDLRAQGLSQREAAQRAAQVFTERYAFRGDYRIPRGVADEVRQVTLPVRSTRALAEGAQASTRQVSNADMIERGASAALSALLDDRGSRLSPNYASGGPDERAGQNLARLSIENTASWVTLSDESGLQLVADFGLASAPVLDAGGRPVRLSWDELSAIGKAEAEGGAGLQQFDRLRAEAAIRAQYEAATGEPWPEGDSE